MKHIQELLLERDNLVSQINQYKLRLSSLSEYEKAQLEEMERYLGIINDRINKRQ